MKASVFAELRRDKESRKLPASQSFRLRYASPRQAAGTRKAESRKKKEKISVFAETSMKTIASGFISLRRDKSPDKKESKMNNMPYSF
jgi:hypothetical protein